MRKISDLYQRIIVWSDEDNCFIGSCPEIMYGGIHGDDALEVLKELNVAIEEAVEIFKPMDSLCRFRKVQQFFK